MDLVRSVDCSSLTSARVVKISKYSVEKIQNYQNGDCSINYNMDPYITLSIPKYPKSQFIPLYF